MDKNVKRNIKLYLDGKQVEGSVKSINAEIRKLTGEMNDLTIGTDEYEKKAKEISNLKGILQAHRKEITQTNRDFLSLKDKLGIVFNKFKDGAITSLALGKGFAGLGAAATSLLGVFGALGTAIAGVFTKAVEAGKWWNSYNMEIEEAIRLTREFTGLTGKDLTHVQSQVSALAKSTGKDFKEVLSTVDLLMEHFGVSADEAINAIKDGIQAGGDLNGTLLQQLQQFGPAAKDAGNSVQDLVAMIVQTRSGIFNEGGMALIQTAENRIRTMSKSTADALDAIGISSQQLEEDLVSGQKTMFEAVQMVSQKLMELPPNSAAVGQALKDVFGKTASNEGMAMIGAIGEMTTNMDDLKDVTGEYGELQRKQIEAQAELSEKFENFFNVGQTGFQELTGKAKLYITQALIKTIDYTGQVVNWFIDFYNKSVAVRGAVQTIGLAFRGLWATAKTVVNAVIDVFKHLGRMLQGVANTFKGIFTLDFDLAGKGLEQIFNLKPFLMEVKDDVVNGFKEAGKAAVDAWNNTVDGKWNAVGDAGHSSAAEQGGVTVYGRRRSKAPSDEDSGKGGSGKGGTGKAGTGKNGSDADKEAAKAEAERRKAVQEALAKVDLEYAKKLNELKKNYLDGEIKDREEYDKRIQDLEMETLRRKMEIAGLEEQQREQLSAKILDAQIKLQEKLDTLAKEAAEKASQEREKNFEEQLSARRALGMMEAETSEETDKALRELQLEHYRELLDDLTLSEEQRSEVRRQFLELSEQEYRSTFAKVEQYVTQMAGALDTAMEGVFEHGISGLKDFAKEVLKTVLDAVEKEILAREAAILAQSIAESSYAGIATAAAKMTLIASAFAAAKAAIGSCSEGGYTGKGRKDEPAGTVHKGEYVLPQEAVDNPAFAPVLEVAEKARQRNGMRNVKAADIAQAYDEGATVRMAVPNVREMARRGGSIVRVSQSDVRRFYGGAAPSPSRDSVDLSVLREVADVVRGLRDRLEEPIVAETYTVGRGGIDEAQALVTRMRENAARYREVSS